ncbi:DUF6084 family protein [Dictyobacter arantiisoli]|uniref:Uncharacterized protein n=1 Tax=Dictyobacter arantiisoli TaxID=2014874 RepID=A0A5A5TFF0_9CHLR|nr:DUF6084 family protein [Dictyobacter arantiisoli]GCF09968.1 hypothetical protein KDI_35320 [Dictyobacter arantiisoli]
MPDLSFEVLGAEAVPYSTLPMLNFKLRIGNANPEELIQNINLKCQIMLSVTQRRYAPEEKAKLFELFGEPERWGKTLRTFLWTHVPTVVPRFSGNTTVDLPVPCLYDFEVVSTRYFNALEDGDVPLTFLFSGTVFYAGAEDNLQISQISWSKEATYRLPVAVWKEVIHTHFPNTAWIRLPKDVFDELYQYKIAHGLITWEQVLTRLLQASGEEVKP